jgi:hypothetical protein
MSIRSVHSARALRIHLSAKQFARGVRGGIFPVFRPSLAKISSKAPVNFAVAVADQETEGADPVAEVHEQVAGLLGGPRAVRVCGHAEDVHGPGGHLHDEQHVQALEEDRVHMKEIAGQQAISLRIYSCPCCLAPAEPLRRPPL